MIRRRSDTPRLPKRQRALLWFAVAAAVLSTGGLAASAWVKSPAQEIAETKAPPPTRLTAPVVSQVLAQTVVIRGTFSAANTVNFTPTSAIGPDGNASQPTSTLVVSKVCGKPGQQVADGSVLAEVNYRPVFALQGDVPAVRDMVQGESGPDIAELQAGLQKLGYGTGYDQDGVFGAGTAYAVKEYYQAIGYPEPTSVQATTPDATTASAPPSSSPSAGPSSSPNTSANRSGSSTLVEVPKSEVVFLASFPALLTSAPTSVGSAVSSDAPLLQLTSKGLQLTAQLDPTLGTQVRAGMAVAILSESTGIQVTGKVDSVGATVIPTVSANSQGGGPAAAANGGSTTPYDPVAIASTDNWPAALDNQNVRITITSSATSGAVLAVPEAAISAGADGVTAVTVVGASGAAHRIPVQAGASADGLVQVTPTDGGRLTVGDRVVIG